MNGKYFMLKQYLGNDEMLKSKMIWLFCISTVVAGLALLLVNVRLGLSCDGEGSILICRGIPSGEDLKFENV